MKKRILLTGLGLGLLAVSAIVLLLSHHPAAKPPVYLQSPLGAAILSYDAPRVEQLLRQGADPNVQYSRTDPIAATALLTSSGLSPLMVASLGYDPGVYWDWDEYGRRGMPHMLDSSALLEAKKQHTLRDNPAITQSLLAHGANPNASDSNQWTPLSCALSNSNVNIARALLDGGADSNKVSQFTGTVLMGAAEKGDLAFVRLLLSKGAHINTLDESGRGALTAACDIPEDGYKSQVHMIGPGINPFQYSESSGDRLAVVRLLLSHGAEVNPAQTGTPPMQPLGQAIRWRNAPLMRLLLKSGADPNAPDSPWAGRLLPLMAVPRVGRPTGQGLAFLLIAYGADVNARSRDGNTALTWAADKGDLPLVRLLLKDGAQVNAVNHAGHTALWFAYTNGDGPLRTLLLAQGADAANTQGAALPAWLAGRGNYDIRGLNAFQ